MAASRREKIMLQSTGKNKKGRPTGTYYTTTKNKQNTPGKLELTKYDDKAWDETTQSFGKHVTFKEKKIPK